MANATASVGHTPFKCHEATALALAGCDNPEQVSKTKITKDTRTKTKDEVSKTKDESGQTKTPKDEIQRLVQILARAMIPPGSRHCGNGRGVFDSGGRVDTRHSPSSTTRRSSPLRSRRPSCVSLPTLDAGAQPRPPELLRSPHSRPAAHPADPSRRACSSAGDSSRGHGERGHYEIGAAAAARPVRQHARVEARNTGTIPDFRDVTPGHLLLSHLLVNRPVAWHTKLSTAGLGPGTDLI
ncbi:hypothetical protein B0H10DRAFT_1943253 [Mycena sp. CBHHK59/15]|nr:hypothetical protein B0H10DRAFT_1943253 [Mycena sp. CBHHK59/15]